MIGFNVRPVRRRRGGRRHARASRSATYSVIYKIIEELRAAMEGLLAPEEVEETVGDRRDPRRPSRPRASARSPAPTSPRASIRRGAKVRLVRDGTVIYDGRIGSLRRFKDDVREVTAGMECGIVLENYADMKEGDVLEVVSRRKQVEQTLAWASSA